MLKLSLSVFLFFAFVLFSAGAMAQTEDDSRVVHVQTSKFKAALGDDAEAFAEMLKRQAEVYLKDPRLLSSDVLRHGWGNDSRDLVIIAAFKDMQNLESFYDDLNSMLEEGLGKEQYDKDNELWGKYVGMHSDEIYVEAPGTRK